MENVSKIHMIALGYLRNRLNDSITLIENMLKEEANRPLYLEYSKKVLEEVSGTFTWLQLTISPLDELNVGGQELSDLLLMIITNLCGIRLITDARQLYSLEYYLGLLKIRTSVISSAIAENTGS